MTKILVIRFSSIGDIVLISPILRCIKGQVHDAELHVLTKKEYVSLFSANPNVDKIHAWGEDNEQVLRNLKQEHFDFVVDLHKNLRTSRVRSYLRRKSGTFSKLNIQKWLLVNFKWNTLPTAHIVDRYFSAVKSLGVINDQKGLDFYISINEKSFKTRFGNLKNYIVAAIGAKFATKKMPAEQLSQILCNIPAPIVLIGGKEDREDGEKIRMLLPNQSITNTCGGFSFQESAQIIKNAQVLVTHDTGMMHIGAAFDLPIISIWGNTVPEFGMYPYRPKSPESFSIHEVKGLSCRPCSKIGFKTCPKGHFNCMINQNTKEIRAKVLSFYESKGKK